MLYPIIQNISFFDRIRTAEFFSAYIMVYNLKFISPDITTPKYFITFGGGWKNPIVLNDFKNLLTGKVEVLPEHKTIFESIYNKEIIFNNSDSYGYSAQFMEARIFADMAYCLDNNIAYTTHAGEAAFYGPKIDIKVMDAIGRLWQLSTIQFDFNLPQRFDLEYVAAEGRKRPIMVHRAMFGSIERFTGVILEHFAGWFPLWLAPVQAKILTLTDDQIPYAKEVAAQMRAAGLRPELDVRPEKLGLKIREAHLERIPYTFVIGAKEAENKAVTVRLRDGKNLNGLPLADVIAKMKEEVDSFSLVNLLQ